MHLIIIQPNMAVYTFVRTHEIGDSGAIHSFLLSDIVIQFFGHWTKVYSLTMDLDFPILSLFNASSLILIRYIFSPPPIMFVLFDRRFEFHCWTSLLPYPSYFFSRLFMHRCPIVLYHVRKRFSRHCTITFR